MEPRALPMQDLQPTTELHPQPFYIQKCLTQVVLNSISQIRFQLMLLPLQPIIQSCFSIYLFTYFFVCVYLSMCVGTHAMVLV